MPRCRNSFALGFPARTAPLDVVRILIDVGIIAVLIALLFVALPYVILLIILLVGRYIAGNYRYGRYYGRGRRW